MKEKNDFQLNIKFLNEAVSKSSTSKKRITDNDLKNADLEAVQKHTKAYSDYLEAFVSDFKLKTRNQRKMKIVFFVVTLILLLVIIGGGVGSIFIISKKQDTALPDVATVITAVVGAVSSFLILPKVIADNLFPSKEDDRTAEIFGKMFEHDINIRNIYNVPKSNTPSEEEKED